MRKLFLLCFLVITRTSSAEVNESLVYTYYIANADPTRSLLSILNASSPIRQNGQVFHAHTSWYVNWNFRWFENPDGRCRITKVTTGLTGSISLPGLVDATPMQGRQFDIYLSFCQLLRQLLCQCRNDLTHEREVSINICRTDVPALGSHRLA